MQGFINNAAAVAAIGSTFDVAKPIILKADTTADGRAVDIPQACFYSHLTINVDTIASSAASVQAMLTWDVEGDDILAGPTNAGTLQAGLTGGSTTGMVTFSLNSWITATAEQSANQTIYLWLKTDTGTLTVPANGAKLFWATPATRP